jgi:hypothetical protein
LEENIDNSSKKPFGINAEGLLAKCRVGATGD